MLILIFLFHFSTFFAPLPRPAIFFHCDLSQGTYTVILQALLGHQLSPH